MKVFLDPQHLFLKVSTLKSWQGVNCWDSLVCYLAEQFQLTHGSQNVFVVFGEGCLINLVLQRSEAVGEGRICGLETLHKLLRVLELME